MPRPLRNVNFAKIIMVLAIVFGVALGSCGITAVIALSGAGRSQGSEAAFAFLGRAELLVMILSAVGLVVVVAVWIIASILGNFSRRRADPQRPFDHEEDEEQDQPPNER